MGQVHRGDRLPELPTPSKSLSIRIKRGGQDTSAPIVVGVYSNILCPVDRDLNVPLTAIRYDSSVANEVSATIKRFGCDMPNGDNEERKKFFLFSTSLLESILEPIVDTDVHTLENALEDTSYSKTRKEQLINLVKHFDPQKELDVKVKSFIKDEGYLEMKYPRAINSPSDLTKAILLPLWKAVDEATFKKLPGTIKGTRPDQRYSLLDQMLGDEPVLETDFSSMEAHHEREFIDLIFWWFCFMTRNLENFGLQKQLTEKLMKGRHLIEFKNSRVSLDQRLMSGALWTSSSNTVLNYCLMNYIHSQTVYPDGDVQNLLQAAKSYRGMVEGDDGICVGQPAQDLQRRLIIDRLGLKLKFSYHNHHSEANFCGMTCDPCSKSVVKDPIGVLLKFFVLPRRYKTANERTKLALLRARAMSYKSLFPNAPIIGKMCDYVLYRTRSYIPRFDPDILPYFMKAEVVKLSPELLVPSHPTDVSRMLVSDLFGVSRIAQIEIEAVFDDKNIDLKLNIKDHVCDDVLNYSVSCHTQDVSQYVTENEQFSAAMRKYLESDLRPLGLGKTSKRVEKNFKNGKFEINEDGIH